MKVSGASVLVTGGGSGLGRGLVEGFLARGARVCVFEQNGDACRELEASNNDALTVLMCDVTDPVQIDEALERASGLGFMTDVLINNAGIIHSEPLLNIASREDRRHGIASWRRVLTTDLESVFLVTRSVVDQMWKRRHKGVIVSISSVAHAGNAGQTAYAAAKAGVNAMTKTWARELGPLGFRFAAIAPGFIDTPSTRNALSETVLTRLTQQIPLRRLGTVDAVVQAACQVVENDYINGAIVAVDGGVTL